MRETTIIGNWKMYKTSGEAAAKAAALLKGYVDASGLRVAVAPPFTALESVSSVLKGGKIALAAQNMHSRDEGAFTGEVSAPMLKALGVGYVILGHSERRHIFGESDAVVNAKVKAALAHGLTPVLCVGETLQEREAGLTERRITEQLEGSWEGIGKEGMEKTIVAYEPVWAIGTGKTASPAQAQEVHRLIRKKIHEIFGKFSSDCAILLYGGSVKPENARVLMKEEDVDGVLVGGASLSVDSFLGIIAEGSASRKEKGGF